jgi:hypothetical protein
LEGRAIRKIPLPSAHFTRYVEEIKMKVYLLTFLIVIILFAISQFLKKSKKVQGTMSNILSYIDKLIKSTKNDSFLIIIIKDTNDFIQFTKTDNGVKLDFPLVTQSHKDLENQFRDICSKYSLNIIESKGTDGTRFLDVNIQGSSYDITKINQSILTDLFKINSTTALLFDSN